jgi:hypothetical protein
MTPPLKPTRSQKQKLLKLAYDKNKLEEYIKNNNLNPEDVYDLGVKVYNDNLGDDTKSGKGKALADNTRDIKNKQIKEHEYREAQEFEDDAVEYYLRKNGLSGGKSKKNNKSKKNKSRRIRA